jgi:hypothetical protein
MTEQHLLSHVGLFFPVSLFPWKYECFCGLGMCGWSYWYIKVAAFLYCINNTVRFFFA